MSRYLMPVYVLAVFLSAFLLFAVQPMVGKYLLPLLGGTPSVWNTAMVFFQLLLLAGYIYAHLLAQIKNTKIQAALHIALMALAAFTLPITLPASLPSNAESPVLWQLKTMIGMAAAPFFVLSASAPLLQKWFSHTSHHSAANPYFLYAASNIGSMLALLSYPFVTEPLFGLYEQSHLWMMGYIILSALFLLCISVSKFHSMPSVVTDKMEAVMPWKKRLIWVFLAFIPSSLMLGLTTHITTDIASVPLFWVLPLALYLGTFIIAFSTKPPISLTLTRIIYSFLILILVFINTPMPLHNKPWMMMTLHTIFFFFAALLCHQELVAVKPKASKLTEFYLFISLGGALGGIFNSLVAPFIFKMPLEYYLAIILSLFALKISQPLSQENDKSLKQQTLKETLLFPGLMIASLALLAVGKLYVFIMLVVVLVGACLFLINRRVPFLMTVTTISFLVLVISLQANRRNIFIDRNFFGIIKVQEDAKINARIMLHGTTTHGAQSQDPKLKLTPVTYYYPEGPAGDIFAALGKSRIQNIAALGLGVGSIACYHQPGRSFDFYEIDPDALRIAEDPKYFSYLKNCGSPYKIKLGDARREIETAPDHNYDLIFVDVFSSDNIPIHVMTLEAMKLYRQKLKQGGIISVHISNRFFSLANEVTALGHEMGMTVLVKSMREQDIPGTKMKSSPTQYTVLLDDAKLIEEFRKKGWKQMDIPGFKPWTDDYANILRSLRL